MSNPLLSIIAQADENNWCTDPYCTTCGSLDYRKQLKELAGDLGGPLANALEEIDIEDLTTLPNWSGALQIAFISLPLARLQAEGALRRWLPQLSGHIDFADHVLFQIVRYLPAIELKEQWIDTCLEIALAAKNASLIETLILVLDSKANEYPALIDAAYAHANKSRQMRWVLNNKCGTNYKLG